MARVSPQYPEWIENDNKKYNRVVSSKYVLKGFHHVTV
jgi:hypothetical protein